MSYKLLISEKPQSALKVAIALADGKVEKKQEEGIPYYKIKHNGEELVVACAVGHLFNLAEEKKGTWTYPVFNFTWQPSYKTNKDAAFTKKYIDAIKSLVKGAKSFYNFCDVDVEGELIFRNVLRFICNKEDAHRAYFSTLTKEELINAFENAKPHIDIAMAESGEARHGLDWLYGVNLSRALTLAIKAVGRFKVMSSGRVQGPTLKLIVDKEKEIMHFKPKKYWQLELDGNIKKNEIVAWHKQDKFWEKKEAETSLKNTKGKKALIQDVKKKEIKQEPPAPFDLTNLQMEAYRVFGISPKQTLALAQDLYLAGLISYPRTSSQQLPEALNYKKIITLLSKQKPYSDICNNLLKGVLKPNNGKKTDAAHPALHPTGEVPNKIGEKEFKIYDLVVRRTLATFSKEALRESIEINIEINKEMFATRGSRTLEPGWHTTYKYLKFDEQILPEVEKGEEVKVKEIKMHEKETMPPKRYTPASIIKELSKRNLGTKSISGDTLIYVNGEFLPIKYLFNNGIKTDEKLLVKIPIASFYDLNRKKVSIKNNVLVAKRLKEKKENMFTIETPFTKIISDFKHKYFLINSNKEIYEKKANSLKIGEELLFTKLNSFGNIIITKDWLNSIKRKFKLQEESDKLRYQSGLGFEVSSLPIYESDKLYWLLGYIYGDGSINKRNNYDGYTIGITIDKNETFLIFKLIKTLEDLFGKGCYGITTPSNKNTIRIDIPSVISYYLIKKFPSLASKSIFKIPEEYIGSFVKGYMDSDGNIHLRGKNKVLIKGVYAKSNNTARIKLVLSRRNHVLWIKQMLNLLGIKTTSLKYKLAKIKDKKYDSYEIKISGRDNILLYAIHVGFEHPKKRDKLYAGLFTASLQYKPIKKLIRCLSESLKNNNNFIKFEDKITYILRNYEKLKIIERKKIGIGYVKKYSVRIIPKLIPKICNFLLPLYGKEVIPYTYSIKIMEARIIDYKPDELYDVIVDKNNPSFIILGGQVIHNSTRSEIVDTLFNRNYIHGESIQATDLGIKTVETLEKYSPEILDENLTRYFEKEMDKIQEGKIKKEKVLEGAKKILTRILTDFKKKEKNIGEALVESIDETQNKMNLIGKCPKCEGDLKIMFSPKTKSKFIGCSNYPKCTAIFNVPKSGLIKNTKNLCKVCNYPKILVIRKGKRPQEICINPNCKSKQIDESLLKEKRNCPKCGKELVIRKGPYGPFFACPGYPNCKYIEAIHVKDSDKKK